jgi:hypothetical protein
MRGRCDGIWVPHALITWAICREGTIEDWLAERIRAVLERHTAQHDAAG